MTIETQIPNATTNRPASWLALLIFAVGYYGCAELGRALSPASGSYVSFWLPTGLYVAMLLRHGSQSWLRIVGASLPVNLAFDLSHGSPLLMTFGFITANSVEAVASAWLVRRFVGRHLTLTSIREFWGLILFAAVIGPALGAFIGAATLVAYGYSQSFAHTWLRWCSGNVMAVFLLTPLLLRGLSLKTMRPYFGAGRQCLEAAALVLGLSAFTYYLFVLESGITSNYKFAVILFFLWAALRFGVIGASAISLWLAIMAGFCTVHFGKGLTPEQIASGDYVPWMQIFLAVAALSGLVPAMALEERNEFTAKLRASENQLRTMIAAEPECVKLISPSGKLLEMNPAGLAMLEMDSLAAAQSSLLLDFIPPEHQPAFIELHKRVMQGESGRLEFEIIGKRGTRRWVETCAAPLNDESGQAIALLGVTRDMTERKRLEDQLRQSQKMDAIGQLSGGIAHDFNNILTAIIGNASLLSDPQIERGEARECLEEINRAAHRAADLTRQLLLFSRKQAMKSAVVDLNQAVSQSIKMLQRILGEDIALQFEPVANPLPLFADAGMIEQAILNLAVNARDAMPHGGHLQIRTGLETIQNPEAAGNVEAKVHATLTVIDKGTGIIRENLPHIFEPFFTTKEVGKGTGLGLATVYGIVRQHNGWITVHSEPGTGSTFKIFFPICRSSTIPAAEAPFNAPLPRGTGTILVVEDEPPVRSFVCHFLQRLGYTVISATNGAEAIQLWQQHQNKISLLLTDIVMPGGMSGPQLAARLRTEDASLKIVFMSGYSGKADENGTPLVEGQNFIRKPFDPEALAEIIHGKMKTAAGAA